MNRYHFDSVLAHMIRSEEMMGLTADKIDPEELSDPSLRDHRVVWFLALGYYRKYGKLIPEDVLTAEAHGYADTNEADYPDRHMVDGLLGLIAWCFKYDPKGMNVDWAVEHLNQWLYEQHTARPMQRLVVEHRGVVPEEKWRDLISAQKRIVVSPVITPFSETNGLSVDDMLKVGELYPTGVTFIDLGLAGGVAPGELYGYLAPPGGGKTTLARQLGLEQAIRRRHFVLFSYEQDPNTPDYKHCLMAYAAELSVDRFKDKDRPLTDEEKEKCRAAYKKFSGFFHMVNMTSTQVGSGGVPEIASYVKHLEARGNRISGICIDWLWPMIQKAYAASKESKRMDQRNYAQLVMTQLKSLASEMGIWIWINHQLTPSKAGTHRNVDWNDAAEFKSFAWLVSFCFGVNALDNNGIAKFCVTKARQAARTEQWIRLKGALCRMAGEDKHYSWDNKLNKYVDSNESHKVWSDEEDTKPKASPSMGENLSGVES